MSISNAVRGVVRFNRRISKEMAPRHLHMASAYSIFSFAFYRLLAVEDVRTVLDVGAGRTWFFESRLKERLKFRLIGIDISQEELEQNPDLDERYVADACTNLGVPDGSVDLITARAGVEHFHDNEGFLRACERALRPGGHVLISFAGRYAPFAVLNRALPARVSSYLLKTLIPDSAEKLGFKAHYDRCTQSGMAELARRTDLEVVSQFASFYSSDYFGFFVPLYLLSLTYDHVRNALAPGDAASYYTILLRKPAEAPSEGRAQNGKQEGERVPPLRGAASAVGER